MSRSNSKKSKVWLVLFILFLMIAAGGIIAMIWQNHNRQNANQILDNLNDTVNTNDATGEADTTAPTEAAASEDTIEYRLSQELGIDIPVKNLDFDALHQENPDIYAWIYVPDTQVDYPILQHPTDNSYYLNYNIDGSYGYPGCIYTEDYNSKDFTDPHTVIYGHNLKDQTMFTTLHNFEDPALVNEDHYIFIYTEDYVYVYQIFGAYEYPAVHLLDNYDLTNEYVYEQYLRDVMDVDNTPVRVANIRHDITLTKEDKIVTLSTCTTDGIDTIRFLVAGVLLNPKEEEAVNVEFSE